MIGKSDGTILRKQSEKIFICLGVLPMLITYSYLLHLNSGVPITSKRTNMVDISDSPFWKNLFASFLEVTNFPFLFPFLIRVNKI